jgi:hypothetical protein
MGYVVRQIGLLLALAAGLIPSTIARTVLQWWTMSLACLHAIGGRNCSAAHMEVSGVKRSVGLKIAAMLVLFWYHVDGL